ncbi:MAG: DUF1847 domain-containing protein [Desulfobacterales bacterium]
MAKEKENQGSMCAKCQGDICYPRIKNDDTLPEKQQAPDFCPMRRMPHILERAEAEYQKLNVKEFARLASVQEFECYEHTPEGIRTKIPRLEELIQFSEKCNYTKLGIAFCAGLANEAMMLTDVLEKKGFEVVSVRCKVGQSPKETIGIRESEKIPGPEMVETMCNPISQAMVLNEEKVDLAIMLGLCIGYDTLFMKYCEVPMTVLAVKDRVLAHNPLGALYLTKAPYYRRLKKKVDKTGKGGKKIVP